MNINVIIVIKATSVLILKNRINEITPKKNIAIDPKINVFDLFIFIIPPKIFILKRNIVSFQMFHTPNVTYLNSNN